MQACLFNGVKLIKRVPFRVPNAMQAVLSHCLVPGVHPGPAPARMPACVSADHWVALLSSLL
jgi:hypothetical protein